LSRAGSAHLKQGEQHGGNQRDDPNSDVSFRSKKAGQPAIAGTVQSSQAMAITVSA